MPTQMGKVTHGKKQWPEYKIWKRMRERCRSAKDPAIVKAYQDRGVQACARWDSFDLFISDVGRRPGPGFVLDRVKNELGYEPGNVRWVTWEDSANNQRTNRKLTHSGLTMGLRQWARHLGISPAALHERLAKWPVERALTEGKHQ